MYLVAIAWLYVALLMALAEATAPNGSLLGAVFTFLTHGVGPTALLLYILGTPGRKARLRRAEQREWAQAAGGSPGGDAAPSPEAPDKP